MGSLSMLEKIVAALRRAGQVVFKNLWLLLFAFFYSLAAPLFFLGGTGLPILYWVARGRYFEPALLWKDPLAFILSHWQMILYSMAGCLVGFTVYLVLALYYYGALTGVVSRSAQHSSPEVAPISPSAFWLEGKKAFAGSLATASIASLLPLPPLILLFGLAALFVLRLPSIILGGGAWTASPLFVMLAVAGLGALALTGILTLAAVLWYRYALCAVCVDSLAAPAAMRAALSFFKRQWRLVLGLLVASLFLGLLSTVFTALWDFLARLEGGLSAPVSLILRLSGFPLFFVLGVFMGLWLKAALVVLYTDNR